MADNFINLVEKFLTTDNRFRIIEIGLLKELGGIVLLQSNRPDRTAYKPNTRYAGAQGRLFKKGY
jgi:hypothetical protein